MEINEIVEKLKYYTEDLPKEALKEAIKHKEEITPKLLELLEYTKNNLEKIYYEEDEFFGYIYAIFLLAEFKEQKAFPYLIDLINRDKKENEDIVDYIIGDDYPEYLPRLLASTYNGDDKALFDIIENTDLNEFVRSSVLQTFAILYLNGIKERDFIVTYFKKLLEDKKQEDTSYLYKEIFVETEHLRLIELDGIIDKIFNLIEDKEEIQELKDVFANKNYKINRNIYPFKPCYEYIYDTIGIMEEWQCFRYREDEEYEQSDDNKVCEYIIFNRANNIENNHDLGRNDLCYCGSGKKYKKCCMNKDESKDIEKLDFIDHCISKAEWYLKRKEMKKGQALYKMAWFDVKDICKENNIKSISEYDEKYEGYDSLLNWLQDYDNLLEMCDEEDKLYERLELWDSVEEIFDLSNEINLYCNFTFNNMELILKSLDLGIPCLLGNTDIFDDWGCAGQIGNDDKRDGMVMYSWSGYGVDFMATYGSAKDGQTVNGAWAAEEELDIKNSYSVAVGYTTPDVLFGPISVKAGYGYARFQDDTGAGYEKDNLGNMINNRDYDNYKQWAAAISWGGEVGPFIAALYNNRDFTMNGNGNDYAVQGVEAVLGYGFDCGVNVYAAWEWMNIDYDGNGPEAYDSNAYTIPVYVNYAITPNFNVWAEARFDAGTDDDFKAASNDCRDFEQDVYSVGARYTF